VQAVAERTTQAPPRIPGAWVAVSWLTMIAVMIEAAMILVTTIKSVIDTITSAIQASFNPVAFLVQVTFDPIAFAIESFS